MRSVSLLSFLLVLFAGLLAAFVAWPGLDLAVSGLFASPEAGFFLKENPFLNFLLKIAFYGARVLGVVFLAGGIVAAARQKPLLSLPGKAWLFLLLCLLIGPGLLANVVFKDHWGRARPREIAAFGGHKVFTPALRFSDQCARNCSFVSGDGAFGFFLPCLAYVVTRRRSRKVFWSAMGAGAVFGGARVLLGAHFLSDVLYAAAVSLASGAAIHALMYGAMETKSRWRLWFGGQDSN